MARDPELQALVDQADRQRERAAQVRPEPPPEPERPKPAITFGGYMELDRANQLGMIWWFAPIFVISAGVLAAFISEMKYVALGLGALLACRIALRYLALWRGYQSFLRFPADLSYRFDGWASLLPLANNPEEWTRECTLIVRRAPGADEAVVAAVEDLFRTAANGWFYKPDGPIGGAANDIRQEWKRDGDRLVGSANIWVAGEIYRLARRLDQIQRKTSSIASVEVTRESGTYSFPRPSYSGD